MRHTASLPLLVVLFLVTGAALAVTAAASEPRPTRSEFLISTGAGFDPVAISPQLYTVRFENDRVRVLEYRLKAGGKEPMHSHPPGVVFALADATVRTTLPNGTVVAYPSHAGGVLWRDAVTHSAENVGTTEAHYYAVGLKDASR